jgi:hypothetical protein
MVHHNNWLHTPQQLLFCKDICFLFNDAVDIESKNVHSGGWNQGPLDTAAT